MKKIFGFLLICALLGGGAIFLLRYWLQAEYLPGLFAEGKFLSLENPQALRVSIFPPVLELQDVSWQGTLASLDVMLSAHGVTVEPDVGALLKGVLKIARLDLRQIGMEVKEGATAARERVLVRQFPEIARLNIHEGKLRYIGRSADVVLEDLQAVARNLRPKQEFSLECDAVASIYGGGDDALIRGNFALKTLGRYYAPNMVFREAAVTFTLTEPKIAARLAPSRAQLAGAINLQNGQVRIGNAILRSSLGTARISGASVPGKGEFTGNIKLQVGEENANPDGGPILDSPFTAARDSILFNGAAIVWRNVQTVGDLKINLENPGELATWRGELADGSLELGLAWSGSEFIFTGNADKISLGEILASLGLPGLSGGTTKFRASLHFGGQDAAAMRKSIRGEGVWLTENLALEPFGELRLLLPLLGGAAGAVPEKIARLDISMSSRNGIMEFRPLKAAGPNFTGQGMLRWNLPENGMSGYVVLKTPGLQLPVRLSGSPPNLEVSIDPALLENHPRGR